MHLAVRHKQATRYMLLARNLWSEAANIVASIQFASICFGEGIEGRSVRGALNPGLPDLLSRI